MTTEYITATGTAVDWYEWHADYPSQEPTTAYTIDPLTLTYPDKVQWDIKLNKKGGDDDMRFLYEVILVNPKNDGWEIGRVVARSETSAIMEAYKNSVFCDKTTCVPFDDLKTSCRVLMEWKKEKSLKKAIETIKEAVE